MLFAWTIGWVELLIIILSGLCCFGTIGGLVALIAYLSRK
jgi:hypothetical protein